MTASDLQVDDRVQEYPPTARLIWLLLDATGPLTTEEIADRTGSHHKSVANTLRTLREDGHVKSFEDPQELRRYLWETTRKLHTH